MAAKDLNVLKQKFETGKMPTQQDFHDLLDSFVSVVELGALTEQQFAYGVVINSNIASSYLRRIGNTDKHRALPIQSRMRRCLLRDDGTVNYYLHPNDSSKREDGTAAALDGSQGQVMVEIPEHYRKVTDIDGIRTILISEVQLVNYERIKTCYISAYQAGLDRVSGKLASVVNTTVNFRGGDNTAAWDSTYRSLLGKPVSNLSLTNFRAYARARGSVNWNCLDYNVYKTLFYMYIIEYANLNIQLPYNAQLDPSQFKQGGLGIGVTDVDSAKWSVYNNYNPFIDCGVTNSLGNASGIVNVNMPVEYDAVIKTVSVPSYRGIENIFGHIWHWCDAVKVEVQSESSGAQSKLYTCSNPNAYNDANYVGYTHVGVVSRFDGWITKMVPGEIMPAAVGGDSLTFYCDYFYTYIPGAGVEQRGVLFGGFANNGSDAGLAYSNTNYAPSSAYTTVGSRLCYLT
jgi:hypothetical protein